MMPVKKGFLKENVSIQLLDTLFLLCCTVKYGKVAVTSAIYHAVIT